jgi:hypothetical protein
VTTTAITEETKLFGKVSASRYAKNLLQGDYTSQGKQSESRDRRIESVSGSQPKRHKPASQRGSTRELEELRTESKKSARENSEDSLISQVASSRRRYARVLVVVVSVTVKESSNKPASFKPQLHYLSRILGHVTSWCQKYLNTLQYRRPCTIWESGVVST